ncbi:hypothetical protein BASA61_006821 [Batrachochytrium salamandrivorans]|nr:hypothetical protein BASA61_006821 [Batrachochytrium salamandrivorans]
MRQQEQQQPSGITNAGNSMKDRLDESSESTQRVVPATQRPDGSMRKERRVRNGFIPVEDQLLYTNARLESVRAARRANTSIDAGYAANSISPSTSTRSATGMSSRATAATSAIQNGGQSHIPGLNPKRNVAYRAKPTKAVVDTAHSTESTKSDRAGTNKGTIAANTLTNNGIASDGVPNAPTSTTASDGGKILAEVLTIPTPKEALTKKLKALKKRQRHIDDIAMKQRNGETLNPDQMHKLLSKDDIVGQVKELEQSLTRMCIANDP